VTLVYIVRSGENIRTSISLICIYRQLRWD